MNFAQGKRILVTGANSGIGFQTARQLAAEAGELIMVCRNRERGESARELILREHPKARISLYTADLSAGSSIRELGDTLRRTYDSISILINNAGGLFYERMQSEDGLEYSFALNHMGYFRLTKELLPLLETAAPSRIIQVSSEAHRAAGINFEQLLNPRGKYRSFIVYGRTKLANIMFTREAALRYSSKGITAVSLHPGFVRTNFGGLSEKFLSAKLFRTAARLMAIPPQQGAETPVYLARSETIVNGAYYSRNRVRTPSRKALNRETSAKLWEISEEIF